MENQITADNVDNVQADVIVEVANGPTTSDADKTLAESEKLIVPDILANAGGVTVSYFEWVQNRQHYRWSLDRVRQELDRTLSEAFEQVWQESVEHKVDLRDELPDYLPTVLRLVGRLDDTPEREMFLSRVVGVGVGRMKKALVKIDTPWARAVSSLADVYVAPAEELDDTLHKRIRLQVLNNA